MVILHLAHLKKREIVLVLKRRTIEQHVIRLGFYHKHKKVPLRVFKIAKKNGVFQNLLHLGIRKINKTQRKCQHQNKNCVSCCCCCCFWDYRPSVRRRYIPIKALTLFSFRTNGSLEFDLETSSFASFFTSFLLYHDCLATHVEQKTSVTQCQSRHKVVVGLPCIL